MDRTDARQAPRRGSALAAVLVMGVVVGLLASSLLLICGGEAKSTAASQKRLAAFLTAQSGLERQVAAFRDIQRKTHVSRAFEVIDALAALSRGDKMVYNGCLIARYEAIHYDVEDLMMYYDYRLMAGDQFGFELPKAWAPVRMILWPSKR